MNENTPKKEAWWHRLESGQALVEYWPTIPAAVAVMIAASAIVAPMIWTYQTTADVLNGCEVLHPGPTEATFDGGHHIEVTSSTYDGSETTVVFHVSSADQPSISHWVLGIDKATADKIIYASESYEGMFDKPDPTTGAYGIKFDTGYDSSGGDSGGGKGGGKGAKLSRLLVDYRPRMNVYVEERDIALTFSGYVDFVDYLPVTVKAGVDEISSGTISVPSGSRDIVRCEEG